MNKARIAHDALVTPSVTRPPKLVCLGLLALAATVWVTTAAGCSATRTDVEDLGVVDQALASGFRLPFKCGFATTVTQGNNSAFSHNGVSAYGFDFGVVLNTPLVATKAGRVTFARNDIKPGNPCYSGGGPACASTLNYVTVDHGDNTSTVYAHMNSVSVTVGQMVTQGQLLGLSGGTGYSTGPHTHLQRQQNCGIFYCQSIPMSFDDVGGNGVPVAGQAVKSQNACANVDCALGDGRYCGGNGVKGDTKTLFDCKAGAPAPVEKCAFGCKPMPPGTDDRCATASEAPADAGTDAAAATEADAKAEASVPPSSSSDDTTHPIPPASSDEEPATRDSSCALSRPTSTPSALRALGLAAALALVVRRRRAEREAARHRARRAAPARLP